MLIGWSGIADASVEDAFVVAVIGLLSIPFISPLFTKVILGSSLQIDLTKLFLALLSYIMIPLAAGYYTRRGIIRRKGKDYFNKLKAVLPGFSALGILLIVLLASIKSAKIVLGTPIIIIALILGSLTSFYLIQTGLALIAVKLMKFRYEMGFIFLLACSC